LADCPSCGSSHLRRGGTKTWFVYVALLLLAIPAVLLLHLHAALIAGVMIAAIILAHILIDERVCLDCGHQWRLR